MIVCSRPCFLKESAQRLPLRCLCWYKTISDHAVLVAQRHGRIETAVFTHRGESTRNSVRVGCPQQ